MNKKYKPVSLIRNLINMCFSPQLEFRVRLYNILAVLGFSISLFSAIISVIIGDSFIKYGVYFIFSIISAALLVYSSKTRKYQRCYVITIVLIFLIGFPFFFLTGRGYYGSMTYFFVFAILFTIFMLEGKNAIYISLLELIVYIAICLYAWRYIPVEPEFLDAGNMLYEAVFGFTVVSAALGFCLYIHFHMYNEQQKKLDEQNSVLAQANKFKTEFLANASHEMRTPLTVTSVNVQTVMEILEDMGEAVSDPEAEKLLQNAQNEIMRLSRMVGGMLTLASMSETTERQKLDLASLLMSGAEMLRLHLGSKGNTIEMNIESELSVFGNADLLAQVLTNIMQNSGAYTENGTVTVTSQRNGNEIITEVSDTGTGIPAEIISHVFERGFSTQGTGFGLYLCKTIVESHGGRIWAESELGKGTSVFYSLPFYEGQFGGG